MPDSEYLALVNDGTSAPSEVLRFWASSADVAIIRAPIEAEQSGYTTVEALYVRLAGDDEIVG